MELERKFIWCVRFYDIKAGSVSYRIFVDYSAREIKEKVVEFLKFHEGYVVRVFKNYKAFKL